MKREYSYTLDEIDDVVEELYGLMGSCAIFTFTGPLGAGKTAIIKKLLARCGVKDLVTSPTFTYVNLYSNNEGEGFYHFDLYRIQEIEDFIAAGFDEYLYVPDSWAFIEWPEVIMSILDHAVCHVMLDYISENERRISIKTIE